MTGQESRSPAGSDTKGLGEGEPETRGLLLLAVRLLFLVLLVAVSMLIFAGEASGFEFQPQTFLGVFVASTDVADKPHHNERHPRPLMMHTRTSHPCQTI